MYSAKIWRNLVIVLKRNKCFKSMLIKSTLHLFSLFIPGFACRKKAPIQTLSNLSDCWSLVVILKECKSIVVKISHLSQIK